MVPFAVYGALSMVRATYLVSVYLLAGQTPNLNLWILGGIFLILALLGGAFLLLYAMRRMVPGARDSNTSESFSSSPSTDNPSAFITASMQAVIQKLRDQEKELAALQKRDRERAEQTEKLSETVTRNMPAGLLLINAAGLITSANPAAETALGVRALNYRHYGEVFGNESPLAKLVQSCMADSHTFRREEIEYTTPSGELRQLGVTISPTLNTAGGVAGALCLLSDLTELAALQRQVQVKESMAALGELSAGIAHEFKNSLATISGYAQMIRSEAEGDVKDNAQRILEQTRALAHVVSEFLKFARPLDLTNEEVPMASLVERMTGQVRDALPDVTITTEGDFDNVSGDEGLLGQALLNLLRNAAEAAGGQAFGGRVVARGSVEHAGGHWLQRISISDNGPGIPAGDLSKIFVPFFTTKSNGTGLGLAIVQKIVVQHGGSVEARNQPEGGAELIVWLPLGRKRPTSIDSLAARS
jgi:two-component system sensor histidine kinase PilS (NtrC family)